MPFECPDGEMVDALVSGASAARRVGSSPILGTFKRSFFAETPFFRARIEPVQSVAVWQSNLRLSNVQSCCATLEYRLRNICSNEFGIYSQPIFQTFGFPAHSLCLHCSNLQRPLESCCGEKGCWWGGDVATVDGFQAIFSRWRCGRLVCDV